MNSSRLCPLLFALVACDASAPPSAGNPLPETGNATVTLTDIPGEHPGVIYASPGGPSGDLLSLVFASVGQIGFSRAYTVEEWRTLMDGDEIQLAFRAGSLAYISTVYEVREGVRIGRDAKSEQMRREGELFAWTIEFGEATDSFLQPLSAELEAAELTVTFSADFACSTCIPGSEMPGGGCLTQEDPMLESDFCRGIVRDFDLIDLGFVDPSVLE